MKIIKNVRLYDFERYIETGFLAFETKIIKVGDMSEYEAFKQAYLEEAHQKEGPRQEVQIEEMGGAGALIIPGLVLGHTHIYSAFARGWMTPYHPNSFQDILDQMWWKLDHHLGQEEIYYSAIASSDAFLKNGMTTVIDHHASGQMITGSLSLLKKAVVDEMGLRGLFCFETSDRFNAETCIEENVRFYEETKSCRNHDVAGLLGLHASFSLSDETLAKCAKTPQQMPLHIHVAESIEDVNWTKKHCGKGVVERLSEYQLLREDNLYVHGVHLQASDFDYIERSNGVMAFNPSSNMNNGVGLPPVDQVLERQIPWMMGNDGLGFGLTRDYQTMIFSANLKGPNHFPLEALRKSILTSYAYASRRLGCQLGRLMEGYEADFLVIPYPIVTPMTSENAFGHFVYGVLEHLHPKEVWIKGKQRVKGYEICGEIEKELKEAESCAKKLWKKIEKGIG